MRKVVDSNFLRSIKLRDYLSRSKDNIAVITDSTELEMVKAGGLDDLLKSVEVIADFPRQIVFAKTTNAAGVLRGRWKGLKKRLTDGKRTRAFRKWCRKRKQTKRDEKPLDLERAQAEAAAHVDAVAQGAASIKDDLAAHAANYTDEELRILKIKSRCRQSWSPRSSTVFFTSPANSTKCIRMG